MSDNKAKDDSNASARSFTDLASTTAHIHTVHFLLPSDDGNYVLAETGPENEARLTRASIPIEDNKFFSTVSLQRKVQEVFPFPVYFANNSYDSIEEDIDNPGRDVYQDMWIVHPAGDFPAVQEPLKWIHRDDVSSYRWVNAIRSFRPGHTARNINELFEDCTWKEDERAKPWEALGFYKKLMSWAIGVLKKRSMVMEGRIGFLQDGTDGRIFTCGVRVRDGGHAVDAIHGIGSSEVMFIKSTFPQGREVERTVAVAFMFENIVPEIVGFDATRGILMQRDAGKMTDEPFDQEAVIGTVLYMQRMSLNRLPELEAIGLRVMDTEWLEPKVESIMGHVIFDEFLEDQENIMACCDEKRETLKNMRSKVNLFRKMCSRISKLRLPRTIVHGDCHPRNVGRPTTTSEGKVYQIFD